MNAFMVGLPYMSFFLRNRQVHPHCSNKLALAIHASKILKQTKERMHQHAVKALIHLSPV